MKNNFDLKGYMKSNKVGSYQQLNEMWYQDIQPIGDNFTEAVVIDSLNEEEQLDDSVYKEMVDDIVGKANGDKEQEYDFAIEALKQNQMHDEDQLNGLYKFAVGANYHNIADAVKDVMKGKVNLEEMGGVKNIGDKAKLATPNARPNLGRHRSSDMLDKMSKKDHDKNTVTGAKAAAYKAPHMKEETADDIFAGSEDANWDNYGNETSEWDTEIAGQTVNGWTAEETQGGAIAWQNPKYPNAHIYATPGWEGVDGIAFELHDSEDGYMDEPKIQKVVGSGTDLWKTKAGYMALMAKAFTVVEKMLAPSDNMDEDHGTQINHDMNDDISMDYTEPEHMVQNEDEDPFGAIKTGIDKITQDDDEDFIDDDKLDRFYEMGGRQLTKAADALLDDGFSKREIIDYLQNYM
jgi:hypothetical protein